MQKINEIMGSSFTSVLEKAKLIREEYIRNGYIKTNFGWVHKDWINVGYKMNAIGKDPIKNKDGSYTYSVMIDSKIIKMYQGSGRVKEEIKKEKISHENITLWFAFVDYKRGDITEEKYRRIEEKVRVAKIDFELN